MKYYLNRNRKEQITKLELYSSLALMAGFVSVVFGCMKADHADAMVGISFAFNAVFETVILYRGIKEKKEVNLHNVIRLCISIVFCVIAVTCFDKLFF